MKQCTKQLDPCAAFTLLLSTGPHTEQERLFLREHAKECLHCRLEAKCLALFESGTQILPPQDDITRRTAINALLSALNDDLAFSTDQDPSVASPAAPNTPSSQPLPTPPSNRGLPLLKVAGVALLALGFVLGGVFLRSGRDPRPAAPLSSLKGRVLLSSGPRCNQLQPDQAVQVGTPLQSHGGITGLHFPANTFALLDPESEGVLLHATPSSVEFRLTQGTLLASVIRRSDDPLFVVHTPKGRVEVVGTVFSVTVRGEEVSTTVLQGRVRVLQPGRGERFVSTRSRYTFGSSTAIPLSEGAMARARRGLQLIQMLESSESAASLHVASSPEGALLSVDGIPFGTTPLTTLLRPGHRRIKLSLKGHRVAERVLQLNPGEPQHYDVHLSSLVPLSPSRATPEPVLPSKALPPHKLDRPHLNRISSRKSLPVKRGSPKKSLLPTTRSPVQKTSPPSPSPPFDPALSPAALLKQARRLQRKRAWREAATRYRSLIQRHPSAIQTQIASVALGNLLLDHLGDARGALHTFSAYLKRTAQGMLAQEAAWGRIRALQALGAKDLERQALLTFLSRWPHSLQTPQARHRLKALPPRTRPR